MKVLLIGNYPNDQQRSMLGFAQALETGLKEKGVQVRLIAPRVAFGRMFASRPANAGVRKWLGYIDKFVLFPGELRRGLAWADVVHICDHSNSFYVRHLKNKPHAVTCHDLLAVQSALGEFESARTGATGRVLQRLILNGLKEAENIVCVSKNTQDELQRIGGIPQHKTTVIYNGLYQSYSSMPQEQRELVLSQMGLSVEQPFLLHVGGNQFYKNRLGVLKIFHALRQSYPEHGLRLIMAGKPWPENMRQYAATHDLSSDEVLELTDLSHDQLRALYSQAEAFVFPSLFEGFGLPIIEAQACGCPVFTTNRAPMTEVGGTGAFYFDPDNVVAAAEVISNNLTNTESVVKAGSENIERFSTEKMLNGYVQVYEQVLNGSLDVEAP